MKFYSKFDAHSLKTAYERAIEQFELKILELCLRGGLDPEELDLNWEPADLEDTNQTDLKQTLTDYKKVLQKISEV